MKFKHKSESPWPEDGTIRVRSGFLWFPKRIHNETRWLERATWEEKTAIWINAITKKRWYWTWEPTRWLDGSTYAT